MVFRAAVSAYCMLTRPSRREGAQLEDLALPLVDAVSIETRRYAAAALSECDHAPAALVRRLADEPVEVAAPLLVRSRSLSDVDLLALIGRHGVGHAMAIGRRDNLHATIADLVRALERPRLAAADQEVRAVEPDLAARQSIERPRPRREGRGDEARSRLRAMMLPAADPVESEQAAVQPAIFRKLRDSVLTGSSSLFSATLAELLRIDPARARTVAGPEGVGDLIVAARALGLSEEEAFLIAAAAHGRQFAHAEAVRLFLERYRAVAADDARDRVRAWRAAGLSAMLQPRADNSSGDGALKAS